jgi:hypothetical protein
VVVEVLDVEVGEEYLECFDLLFGESDAADEDVVVLVVYREGAGLLVGDGLEDSVVLHPDPDFDAAVGGHEYPSHYSLCSYKYINIFIKIEIINPNPCYQIAGSAWLPSG